MGRVIEAADLLAGAGGTSTDLALAVEPGQGHGHRPARRPEDAQPHRHKLTLRAYERAFRRELLAHHLRVTNGNRAAAARLLGLQRTYLCRLIREYGLVGEFPGQGAWYWANRRAAEGVR